MAHVDNLRRHFPAMRNTAYLDTGSFGALPDAAVQAMQEVLTWQLEEGRHATAYGERLFAVQRQIRDQLASLLHGDVEGFMLTDGTTHGLNTLLWGLPLQPGDEVIVTDLEHKGAVLPLFVQQQRRGIVIRVIDGTQPVEVLCGTLDKAISARTRLVVCSHVSRATGHRLPIEEMVELAHARGVHVAVDGAQGAGGEEFDLAASGVDFYAFPGHKWLCGPDGVGALYIRRELRTLLAPTFIGAHSLARPDAWNWSGTYLAAPDAGRYEHSRADLTKWTGWLESLQFMRVTVGWDYVYTRTHGLSGQLMEQLLDFDHVRVATPRDRRVGLVHFRIHNLDADQFVRQAAEHSVTVRAVPERQLVRASTAVYNSDDDVARLISVVKAAKP